MSRNAAVRFVTATVNFAKDALLTPPKIDIDRLTEAELIDLNNRIVERLRFLNQMRAHGEMLEFKIGDRVSFQPQGRPAVIGMLTRYNRKTVTVITDDGCQLSPKSDQGLSRKTDQGKVRFQSLGWKVVLLS